jgi:hypothetical protein
MKFFKTLVLASTLMMAFTANAGYIYTDTQTNSFSGTAGSTSERDGVEPFVFDYFDSTLGDLLNVYVSYDLLIDGGLVGADNLTNKEVSGSLTLGGAVLMSSALPFLTDSFANIFNKLELTQSDTFTVAADPTLSVGGNGPDTYRLLGEEISGTSGLLSLNTNLLNFFTGNSGDTYTVDFDTDSVIVVDAPSTRGFFQAVDTTIEMNIVYEYENDIPPANNEVSVPAPASAFLFGLGLAGLAATRKKKQ